MGSDNTRVVNDFLQAAGLLKADLVWSSDFDEIRRPLAEYIQRKASLGLANHPALIEVVQAILKDENDLSI